MTNIGEQIALARDCVVTDTRPQGMRDWQGAHPREWISARHYYRYLFEFARRYKPAVMVELGTDYGYGAWHLAAGNPAGRVIAVDMTMERVERQAENIQHVTGDSVSSADQVAELAGAALDFVFFDSWHDAAHLLAEFSAYDPLCRSGALQCFDDVSDKPGMRHAFDQIPEPKMIVNDLHPRWRTSGPPPGFGIRVKP